MEEVSWIFNVDFEQRLFRNDFSNIQSNRMSQEFEFFMFLLNPDDTVFTTKKYSDDYLTKIESMTGIFPKITTKSKNIKGWCAEYQNVELLKKLQLKENTLKFLIDNGLTSADITFIKSMDDVEEGYLYKYSKSLSGGGHMHFPKHAAKIKKLINSGETLIKEKVLERVTDFSTLIDDGKVLARYENEVDDFFQYKGTIIGDELILPSGLEEEYNYAISKFLDYTKDHRKVLSIDSFTYTEDKVLKLFPACEINVRKTMGHTATQLKKLYFSDAKWMKLGLRKNTLTAESKVKISKECSTNIQVISPLDNTFIVYICVADSREHLERLTQELFLTFF
jgi:hypothetical protein